MRYRQADGLLQEVAVDRTVVVLDDARWVVFEGTALTIWQMLAEPMSLDQLMVSCATIYDASPERIAADVASTVSEWMQRGLVVAWD